MSLESIGGVSYDNLITGEHPRPPESLTILAGQTLVKGSVIALDGAGKGVLVDSGAGAPANAPYAVLADDIDTTAGDGVAIAWLAGQYNLNKLVFGGSDTFATHKVALRALSIYGEPTVKA